VLVHEESPSSIFDNNILPNPLEHSYVLPIPSLPSSSPEYDIVEPIDNFMICNANSDLGHEDTEFNVLGGNVDDYLSLDCFRRYNPCIDPYCVWLGDMLRKIRWTTFFNPSYDFSNAIDKDKRILAVFGVIFLFALTFYFLN